MSKDEFVSACLQYQQAKKDAIEDEYRAYRVDVFRRQNAKKNRKYYTRSRGRKTYE